MLRNHPFSQRSKAIERSVGVMVGDDRNGGWGGLDKICERVALGNIGVVFKK